MTYETALALKEAGFPQGEELSCACAFASPEEQEDAKEVFDCGTERVYVPKLEELIEACGTPLREIKQHTSKGGFWTASTARNAGGKNGIAIKGSTPSEAVAKLWINLHKK